MGLKFKYQWLTVSILLLFGLYLTPSIFITSLLDGANDVERCQLSPDCHCPANDCHCDHSMDHFGGHCHSKKVEKKNVSGSLVLANCGCENKNNQYTLNPDIIIIYPVIKRIAMIFSVTDEKNSFFIFPKSFDVIKPVFHPPCMFS